MVEPNISLYNRWESINFHAPHCYAFWLRREPLRNADRAPLKGYSDALVWSDSQQGESAEAEMYGLIQINYAPGMAFQG